MNDTINDYMLYKKMYYKLFNAVTDALNESNALSKDNILKKVQQECEDMFINCNCD